MTEVNSIKEVIDGQIIEKPITIATEDENIFGILSSPKTSGVRGTIIVTNSRIEYRVGPHRIFVKAARHWAEQGFAVFRFDYSGNGDSEGDTNYSHMDAFPTHVADKIIPEIKAQTNSDNIILCGLCMGARNALYIAAEQAQHVIALAMPISDVTPNIVDKEQTNKSAIGMAVARNIMRSYCSKLVDPKSWLRLLTGKSDFHVIKRAAPAAIGIGQSKIFEESVFLSLKNLENKDGKVLFLFGKNDVFLPDFKEQYSLSSKKINLDYFCDTRYINNANHTFSSVYWQQQAIDETTNWLNQHF